MININDWFLMDDLCGYLPERPSKSTIYSWVSKKSIPFYKRGKRLLFLKSEIDNWLIENYNINSIK